MNGKDIPGFYYDREKKKYFKIQPNHLAPVDAKYSSSSVRHEAGQRKKLKIDRLNEQARRKQTVHRPWSSSNPLLTGAGLHREHGRHELRNISRDQALIAGLENTQAIVWTNDPPSHPCRLTDSLPVPQADCNILAVTFQEHSFALHHPFSATGPSPNPRYFRDNAFWAFHDSIVSMYAIGNPEKPCLLICPTVGTPTSGNLFFHLIPTTGFTIGTANDRGGACTRNVGRGGEHVWATALHSAPSSPFAARLALSTSNSIHVEDLFSMSGFPSGPSTHHLGEHEESFSVGWLNPNTVAFSVRQEYDARSHRLRLRTPPPDPSWDPTPSPPSPLFQGVRLWDVRSSGVASRLRFKSRSSGLLVPDYDPSPPDDGTTRAAGGAASMGQQLLVSNVREFALYDLRFAGESAQPVMRIPHESETPKLEWAVWRERGLVAAVDREQNVRVYSLRTGRLMRVLECGGPATGRGEPATGLRWVEDVDGLPVVQACRGDTVQRWEWKGDGQQGS